MINSSMFYFGGRWPTWVTETDLIPIFALEALTVILGALTWGHLLEGKKVIFRSDSSNTCFAFNRLISRHPGMQLLAELWADCQMNFNFEGLVFHCPGKFNQWADIASRPQEREVVDVLQDELEAVGLTDVEIVESETVWETNGVSARVLTELYEICRNRTDQDD